MKFKKNWLKQSNNEQSSTLPGVKHYKEGASDYTWSCTAYIIPPPITMCKVTLKHILSYETGTTDYTVQ